MSDYEVQLYAPPAFSAVIDQTPPLQAQIALEAHLQLSIGLAQSNAPQTEFINRVDEISPSVIYHGVAKVGSLETDPVWQISLILLDTDPDGVVKWADGTQAFIKVWDQHLGYTYSLV